MDLLLLNNIHTTRSSVNYNKQMKDYAVINFQNISISITISLSIKKILVLFLS